MASFNQVTLMGHIGKKPELRFLPNGTKAVKFSLATNEVWKDKKGEKQDRVDWHYVEFIGPVAEIVEQYLDKGSFVFVQGALRNEKWTDKDGQERNGTKIRASKLKMLDHKESIKELEGQDPVSEAE